MFSLFIIICVLSCISLSDGGGDGDDDHSVVNLGQYTDGDPKYKSRIKNVASIKS